MRFFLLLIWIYILIQSITFASNTIQTFKERESRIELPQSGY